MKLGRDALNQVQAKVSLDEIDDIKADIEEQVAVGDEIADYFADAAMADKDELGAELDEMLAMD